MNRVLQIDALKCVAILMVLINHGMNCVYTNEYLFAISRTCVCIFFFASGINGWFSYKRYREAVLGEPISAEKRRTRILGDSSVYILQKVCHFLCPYALYVAVFQIFIYKGFDLVTFWNHFIHFDINSPCYYIVIFLQLIMVTPITYIVMHKMNGWGRTITVLVLGFFVCKTLCYIFILPIFGAGQRLFGGSYGLFYFAADRNRTVAFTFLSVRNSVLYRQHRRRDLFQKGCGFSSKEAARAFRPCVTVSNGD